MERPDGRSGRSSVRFRYSPQKSSYILKYGCFFYTLKKLDGTSRWKIGKVIDSIPIFSTQQSSYILKCGCFFYTLKQLDGASRWKIGKVIGSIPILTTKKQLHFKCSCFFIFYQSLLPIYIPMATQEDFQFKSKLERKAAPKVW